MESRDTLFLSLKNRVSSEMSLRKHGTYVNGVFDPDLQLQVTRLKETLGIETAISVSGIYLEPKSMLVISQSTMQLNLYSLAVETEWKLDFRALSKRQVIRSGR